ncbi:unnamed protein product, partial [Closterium sp. Yama58-4]
MLLAHSLRRPFRLPRLLPRALPYSPPLAPHSPPPLHPLLRSPHCPSVRCLHSPYSLIGLNNLPERVTSLREYRLPVAFACLFRPSLAIGALNGVTAIGTSNGVTVTDVGGLRRSMRIGIHVPAGTQA